jgi:carboxyl-terminal processing protease
MRLPRATVLTGMLATAAWMSAGLALAWQPAPAVVPLGMVKDQGKTAALDAWSKDLWAVSQAGQESRLRELLGQAPSGDAAPAEWTRTLETAARLKGNFEKREVMRAARHAELTGKITETLSKEATDKQFSDVLRWATELQMISPDRDAALRTPLLRDVIQRASMAARAAEARGDWLFASELFYRLHALTEEQATYKDDMERLNQRLTMLRLYVPEQLWELRKQRALKDDAQKPFPAFNPIGMGYEQRLAGIDDRMVLRALLKTTEHVDKVPLSTVVAGGLRAVRTMATTTDLAQVFAGLKNADAVTGFVEFLDAEIAALPANASVPLDRLGEIMARLSRKNAATVALPWAAVLHEFGNGAVGELDDFSAIIWPDELRRFDRTTQGRVIGIGVQLEYDDQQNIRVAAPISGAPADRAGVRAMDVIAKVNGANTLGMGLDQAIDLITGPVNTDVVIGVQRPRPEGGVEDLEFPIRRAIIDVTTVKGWKRTGAGERDWEYFIDSEGGIGYLRLSQFTETTTRDFDAAIVRMKAKGLNALILDLRYNPGGLLDEAIKMSQRFIDVSGPILRTRGRGGVELEKPEVSDPDEATVAHIPVVVLINENSASASEIVSGALRYYAHTGRADRSPALRGLLIGQRSYGKGSVQTVTSLGESAKTKITIQYYFVPDEAQRERIVHRKSGAKDWGIVPDLALEILPEQLGDSLVIRRNADVARPGDPPPKPVKGLDGKDEPTSTNPDDLLAQGLDLQLEAALLLMQAEIASGRGPEVRAAR